MAHITIDADRCKGCYFCIKFCPKQLIVVSDKHNRVGYFPAQFSEDGEDTVHRLQNLRPHVPRYRH